MMYHIKHNILQIEYIGIHHGASRYVRGTQHITTYRKSMTDKGIYKGRLKEQSDMEPYRRGDTFPNGMSHRIHGENFHGTVLYRDWG